MPGTIAIAPKVRRRARSSPDRLGPYAIHKRLGVGGMATVFRARRIGDPAAPEVAIKRLHPHLLGDDGAIAAFVKEARLALLLDHPAIRRVLSVTRQPDELFLVMEYIDGASLLQLLRSTSAARRLPDLRAILAILIRLCDVIHYAHERVDETGAPVRFVHRDISPSNLIVTDDGALKVIDLGVARARVGVDTRVGEIKGKYGYMAPEVMNGQPFDRRADIYSIGVVAWELLTAHKLFTVRGSRAEIDRIRARPVEPPSVYNPDCPPGLDVIVLQALAPDPSQRWSTASMMCEALESIAATLDGPSGDEAIEAWVRSLRPRPAPPQPERPRTPRLARGTTPDIDARPAPLASRAPPVLVTTSSRKERSLVFGAILGSVTTAAVAITLTSAFSEARPTARVVPSRAAATVDAGPPADATDAGAAGARAGATLTVDPSAVTRVSGPWPKSRSDSYPYRARLCIDAGGKVSSIELLDGPKRLEGRIEYALRRWRYQPYTGRGLPEPVCFELSSNVRKLDR